MPSRWTREEVEWLEREWPTRTSTELSALHSQEFGTDRSPSSIKTMGAKLGLEKDPSFRYNPIWTAERVEWLRENTPGRSSDEIAERFEEDFGIPMTVGQVRNAKSRYGVYSDYHAGCFRKGHATWNKGMTWDEMGISEEKQAALRSNHFQPGMHPHNALPLGSEFTRGQGETLVKVAEHGTFYERWKPKQRLVYEREVGPIPEGCKVVFADHDRANFDPGNLVAVPDRALAVINRARMPYRDRESLEACVALAGLKSACFDIETERTCKVCGKHYKARCLSSRTCPECLEARNAG